MKMLLFYSIKGSLFMLPFLVSGQSSMPETTLPINWVRSGTDLASYTMGISNQNSHSGNQSVFIKSLQLATNEEYGTLATTVKPGKYRGKKIKYSAWLKTEEADSACLWMRIDSPKGITLNFDNMRCRGVHGTTDWHNNSIILYVPDSACQISYGFYILGKGAAWMDDVEFDIAPDSMALTDLIKGDFSCRIPGFKPSQNTKKEPYDTGFEN